MPWQQIAICMQIVRTACAMKTKTKSELERRQTDHNKSTWKCGKMQCRFMFNVCQQYVIMHAAKFSVSVNNVKLKLCSAVGGSAPRAAMSGITERGLRSAAATG